jgi:hypothetical protein
MNATCDRFLGHVHGSVSLERAASARCRLIIQASFSLVSFLLEYWLDTSGEQFGLL